jgi:NitT/TauT family transport system substrate-binding protein
MTVRPLHRRRTLLGAAALALAAALPAARAQQETNIKFQLDWRFEGPAALFVAPAAKGYFKAENLNVTIDAGSGSGGTVSRVASGAYDMGFADMAALMEFHANNPGAPNKPVAVMMVYNNTPAAVIALRKSGIRTPRDLEGRRLGAPVFDAGRRAWPIFAKANKIDEVSWVSMDPPLREAMLLRGDIDAVTGFSFTSLVNLEAHGTKTEDVVTLGYAQYGVKIYGNAVIASEEFVKKNPEAVKAFLRAFSKGVRDVIADPRAAVTTLKSRDGLVNEALELHRLQLAIDQSIFTPDAKADGFGDVNGARLALMASQVSDAYGTKERVNPAAVWNGSFLPTAAERNIFAGTKR